MDAPMARWRCKVAVVTGASSGIGAAICEKLVEEGMHVVGIARRKNLIDDLAKKLTDRRGKLHSFQADLTKEADILAAFDWVRSNLGPVHVLVNNAGMVQNTTLIGGDTEKWRKTFDISNESLLYFPDMQKNNIDGHIIHINSIAGHKVPQTPDFNVYTASKFAVTALTESLRVELNSLKMKTKITSISPGVVASEFILASGIQVAEEVAAGLLTFLKPEDIANAVVRKNLVDDLAKKLSDRRGKLHSLQADLTKEADILAAFDWVRSNLGPVHVLVNNAGMVQNTTLVGGDTEKWRKTFDVNVLGLYMKKNNFDGHIIHINSIAGHNVPQTPDFNVYSASKFAVTALTESLRVELNSLKMKTKITSISPGVVASEFIVASGIQVHELTIRPVNDPF
ncbi:unnamed protein product [Phaedon cochleariae]|uniref:Dehydrogenase/reductase SDR family member 11 n=1 Tax=Phaedon cochleariae TaxID=80249 RepID=A0A9N9SFJ7_PHACE|nr:unnamed protein product [Phaedon cochleariae]